MLQWNGSIPLDFFQLISVPRSIQIWNNCTNFLYSCETINNNLLAKAAFEKWICWFVVIDSCSQPLNIAKMSSVFLEHELVETVCARACAWHAIPFSVHLIMSTIRMWSRINLMSIAVAVCVFVRVVFYFWYWSSIPICLVRFCPILVAIRLQSAALLGELCLCCRTMWSHLSKLCKNCARDPPIWVCVIFLLLEFVYRHFIFTSVI